MLQFARQQVGKPFSNSAMMRSLIWPRKSTYESFFCAELVAAILQKGGMIDSISNPGAATPEGLHDLFKSRATTTANPYFLRQANLQRQLTTTSVVRERHYQPPSIATRGALQPASARPASYATVAAASFPCQISSSSRATSSLRVLNHGEGRAPPPPSLGLTLNSLNFRPR